MFLLIFALTSAVSAGNFPCLEPGTKVRLPSECPQGQVLHSVCQNYFEIRSEGKTCLLPGSDFLTPYVPPDEIVCPLKDKTSDCNVYRARHADCFAFDAPSQTHPPCKEYDAQGEYETRKICAELTDGIPLTGFNYKDGGILYPAIVAASIGQCPTGYCPTNDGKCIRWGHTKYSGVYFSPGSLESVNRPTMFNHGKGSNVPDCENVTACLNDSEKVSK